MRGGLEIRMHANSRPARAATPGRPIILSLGNGSFASAAEPFCYPRYQPFPSEAHMGDKSPKNTAKVKKQAQQAQQKKKGPQEPAKKS